MTLEAGGFSCGNLLMFTPKKPAECGVIKAGSGQRAPLDVVLLLSVRVWGSVSHSEVRHNEMIPLQKISRSDPSQGVVYLIP